MRDVITKAKLEKMIANREEIVFPLGTILTQAARDWAREKGIKLGFLEEQDSAPVRETGKEKEIKRAIVTVLGYDKVGIIASVAGVLAGVNVNILDISQTVLQDFFSMIMIVDLSQCRVDFTTLRKMLEDKGEEMELKITLQHEDIFRYMHRV